MSMGIYSIYHILTYITISWTGLYLSLTSHGDWVPQGQDQGILISDFQVQKPTLIP